MRIDRYSSRIAKYERKGLAPMPTLSRRDKYLAGGPMYLGPKITLTPDQLSSYENRGYICQPKYDGCWCEMRCLAASGGNELWSRNDKQFDGEGCEGLTGLATGLKDTYLVGEIEYSTEAATSIYRKLGFRRIWLYDIHRLNGKDLYHLSYEERLAVLKKVAGGFNPKVQKVLPIVSSWDKGFTKIYERCLTLEGVEGVVLKQKQAKGFDSRDSSGKSSSMLRCKGTFTRDYVVVGWTRTPGGNLTACLGLWDGRKFVSVMQAPLPNMALKGDKLNHEGKVVEFMGWGKGKTGTLRHGQFVRFRRDKKNIDCVM